MQASTALNDQSHLQTGVLIQITTNVGSNPAHASDSVCVCVCMFVHICDARAQNPSLPKY